ncbi:TIGR03032 family protein [Xanthobacter agilis]|uniref:Uncharacterized protein (TIGR03032 family) n=1 Tax=Xanthobacter agilis TaxID=47492 RepID=A0ABU0L890_XANAG|nr:TIGR03032 family protein [Xanthobacter agilis]MDQ0503360.1 uncharacterized protein (TIGR03032 family) [Xanthobacter agilis]
MTSQPGAEAPSPAAADAIRCSPGLSGWLERHRVALALSSYQTGQVFLVGRFPNGQISFYQRNFERAMGLWHAPGQLYLGSAIQVWRLENVLRPGERANAHFDALFVPRATFVTGGVDLHELAVEASGRMVFAATRFSCLATLSTTHSFRPIFTPEFISRLAGDDRCHLNGLALEGGVARYVTVCGRADTPDGWRAGRRGGGLLIRIADGAVVAEGLSMPHSPRVEGEWVYLLDSGRGYLVRLDPLTGAREDVAFCPGFLRGLSLHGGYALVTVSLPRSFSFEGLPLQQELDRRGVDPRCGLAIINLASGRIEEWIWFEDRIREMFDVVVLPGLACPMAAPAKGPDLAQLVTIEESDMQYPQVVAMA